METPIRTSMDNFTYPHPLPPSHDNHINKSPILSQLRQHTHTSSPTPPYTPLATSSSPSQARGDKASDSPLHSTFTSPRSSLYGSDFARITNRNSLGPSKLNCTIDSPLERHFRFSFNSKFSTPLHSPAIHQDFDLTEHLDRVPVNDHRNQSETQLIKHETSLNHTDISPTLLSHSGQAENTLSILDGYCESQIDEKEEPTHKMTVMMPPTHIDITHHHIESDLLADYEELPNSAPSNKPKSPGKFGSFFGWGNAGQQPLFLDQQVHRLSKPILVDINRANDNSINMSPSDSGVSMMPFSPSPGAQVLEEELRFISADLAASIRREMELEDIIERLQTVAESSGRLSPVNKRTSDYFSDAGSYAYDQEPPTKSETDFEKTIRKTEQEKAQLRLDMLQKLQEERLRSQEERSKRQQLESHVNQLEQHIKSVDPSRNDAKIHELESNLEEARRKLVEERNLKSNFEDLISALRQEHESYRNERDNLRDEIVPQLKAQVEGLEAEAADFQRLSYEHSRMQQNIDVLQSKNAALMETHRQILEMRTQQERNIMQHSEKLLPPTPSTPVSSNANKDLVEKIKDIEAQRDALQQALRQLRIRNSFENDRAQNRIKFLESERDNAAKVTLKRSKKTAEVSSLRNEIDQLRKRADDAIESKYVCEKGLASLKMDMDRAEQETEILRNMLRDHDTLVTEHSNLRNSHQQLRDLAVDNESTASSLQQAMLSLKVAADKARKERDSAKEEADDLRRRTEDLRELEAQHFVEEESLSKQLRMSAVRVEELAAQVLEQLNSNSSLRTRLSKAVERGEHDQTTANHKINNLQSKLKFLEEKVLVAQQKLEDATTEHEQEVRLLKDGHSNQLRRMKTAMLSTPQSPLFSRMSLGSPRLPKFEWMPQRGSISGDLKTHMLEQRVKQLENALENADKDMEEVVSRLNSSQIEVAELRNERDDALQQTRRLHAQIEAQHSKYVKLLA